MGVFGAQPAQLTSLLQSLSAVHTGLSGGAPSGGATQVPEAAAAGGGATASAGGPSSAHQQQGMGRAARASSEPRPATSYNARHQQAEARRRSRINERLEALRQLVPHTERANTAQFLEELVLYVQGMQRRVAELVGQLGLPLSLQPATKPITFSDDTPEQTLQTHPRDDRHATQSQPGAAPLGHGALPPAQQDKAMQALAALLQHQHAQHAAATAHGLQLQHQHQRQHQQQPLVHHLNLHLQLQQGPAQLPPLPAQAQAQESGQASRPPPPQRAADSAADRQQSTGLQALAEGGLRSASQAFKDPAAAGGGVPGGATSAAPSTTAGPADAAQAVKRGYARHNPVGIPTDEELDMLHLELTSQQDVKRRRMGVA
ncbi:transcription factor BIM2-like isoform X2 [Micractinium conductrix]|uniref:Transcription factor BIM2-like isoform X2 n=1 Tax=Micractinium conductrix TaxID=554055 RepID=A0A2P6VGU7_9CHLO|nr:transcription factor BIM2-like isoform X2 [Micractinium conductrix]|eukprot:PSC73314.1 transcription factor BIM2-like isoform X2 [Micractinium conductrix]